MPIMENKIKRTFLNIDKTKKYVTYNMHITKHHKNAF